MSYEIEHINTPIGPLINKSGYTTDVAESMIALEFENETKEAFDHPRVNGWTFHIEGSLRHHGFEYVMTQPRSIEDTERYVRYLFNALNRKREGIPFTNSIRTSTHVHFDVTQWNYFQVINFALVYWILEDYLSNFCGESRKGNLFCLRMKDSYYAQSVISRGIKDLQILPHRLIEQNYRYASINFASIPKFGSLEFRLMRGVDNSTEALIWVKILEAIKKFSFKFKTPLEVKQHYISECTADEYPEAVLGPELSYVVDSFVNGEFSFINSIRDSFLNLTNIFNCHATWDFTKEIEDAKKSREDYLNSLKKKVTLAPISSAALSGWQPVTFTPQAELAENADVFLEEPSNITWDTEMYDTDYPDTGETNE